MTSRSLTTRLACLFALLCMLVLGSVGLVLYRGLATQLVLRDDAALVTRVEQIRTLLQDSNTLQLVHDKPRLFENMLGNREALLVLGFAGEPSLIEVNPARIAIPDVAPVASHTVLRVEAVQHSTDASGTPFSALAANVRIGQPARELRITAGRLMTERQRILDNYRLQIIWMSLGATVLAAGVAFALVRRGLRPLAALAVQAEKISIDNLDTRLDADRAPHELAPLVASFNAMLERLADGFVRLGQVTADMAHDLRTPIATLLGQTEVALGQARSADYYHALLVSNQEELQRLSRMTDNMLFLARSDHADTMIEPAWLDIATEFERIGDYFEGLAEDRALVIACTGSGKVWADPLLLRRALANLLANAIHYADAPSTITLSAQHDAEGVMLCVENHGPHIAEHQLTRLFDRFYRADTARRDSSQSSGLGLSIVHTIMALHRGSAHAASADGINRFTLRFLNK
ncbi:MAG: heavy metal sensor histidine kinase [Pseudomonadota bacterium]|nr:heavy metal sensor histidine kinase [Pseudomonadota bacterium]